MRVSEPLPELNGNQINDVAASAGVTAKDVALYLKGRKGLSNTKKSAIEAALKTNGYEAWVKTA